MLECSYRVKVKGLGEAGFVMLRDASILLTLWFMLRGGWTYKCVHGNHYLTLSFKYTHTHTVTCTCSIMPILVKHVFQTGLPHQLVLERIHLQTPLPWIHYFHVLITTPSTFYKENKFTGTVILNSQRENHDCQVNYTTIM